jgi:AraC-like DNA-binding protein
MQMIDHTIKNRHIDLEVYYKSKISDPIIHMHNYYEIYLIVEGEINFFLNNTFYPVKSGDLILIRDNHIHGPKPVENYDVTRGFIQFSPYYASKFSTEETNLLELFDKNAGIIHLDEKQFVVIRNIILNMHKEHWVPSKIGHNHLMDAYFIKLIFEILNYNISEKENKLDNPKNDSLMSDIVRETLNFVRSSLQDPVLSLEMIAEEVSYNKTYLNRIFKEEVGSSIYQYILINRISLAKQLMKEGLPPKECSYACGFNNYSNFFRAFKKHTDISPSDYVKYYCNTN